MALNFLFFEQSRAQGYLQHSNNIPADLEESRPIFNKIPVPYFYKRKCLLFPLENQNDMIFSGFETPKSGQLRLNREGWQVCNKHDFHLNFELIFWYSTNPAMDGKFSLDA